MPLSALAGNAFFKMAAEVSKRTFVDTLRVTAGSSVVGCGYMLYGQLEKRQERFVGLEDKNEAKKIVQMRPEPDEPHLHYDHCF